MQNGFVDRDFMGSAPHHFNNEAFTEGRNLIIQGTAAIKANVRTDNLQSARETLGRVCHTLQVGEREMHAVIDYGKHIATKSLKNMVLLINYLSTHLYSYYKKCFCLWLHMFL